MGFQSYNYYFDNREELKTFIDAINEYHQIYNAPISQEEEEIGENFRYLFFGKLKKPYKRLWYRMNKKFVAGFGIGGGRSYCETFFLKRGCYLEENHNYGCWRKIYKKSMLIVFGMQRQNEKNPSLPHSQVVLNEKNDLVQLKDTILIDILDKVVLA
jgi:hypothetical protein